MKLTILGCHAATPRTLSNPSAQALEVGKNIFLIDCGEATQVQLRKNKVRFARINQVFISHLHGDHVFGLVGLISTFMLLGRKNPLHLYGPVGLKEFILVQLKLVGAWSAYDLIFHELSSTEPELIFENDQVSVTTIPLNHRVYTNGFLFVEKPGIRKLDREAAKRYEVESCYLRNAVLGKDVPNARGELVKAEWITYPPPPVKSYAYCSDTAYSEAIIPIVKGVSAMYHESTFLDEHFDLAGKTGHSTAKQAAAIAKSAGISMLILGHYSTRYDSLEHFKNEAQEIFDNVELAQDGKVFEF